MDLFSYVLIGAISIFVATEISSWDEDVNGPAIEPDQEGDSDKRAYIQVRSSKDIDTGVVTESRMDIRDSEIHHLGYKGSEAYGLSWKVVLRGTQTEELLEQIHVYGDVINNKIHHNYFGFLFFRRIRHEYY